MGLRLNRQTCQVIWSKCIQDSWQINIISPEGGFVLGCIHEVQDSKEVEGSSSETWLDQTSILPDWEDGEYHDYYGTMEMLNDFNEKYPDLVYVHSIGESVLGRDIWCIRITNEKNNEEKFSCLIDGCIHGCEWEAGEACLYLTEYLLINFDSNKTITNILNTTEVYIIPLVNPDGRQKDNRFNLSIGDFSD